ncbi:MAG: PIN domain-containing protein [Propionibacteriaceae bacterium]|nr:PIN domain-containing protein [Propionibacteriaceae bacterium]
MSRFLVDTSVWSLAYRRDTRPDVPQVAVLRSALVDGEYVAITGMVLLELLRGFIPARAQERILADLAPLELIEPTRDDYVEAARLANICRQAGVQLGSVDALLAQLAIANGLELLTTDRDFENAAKAVPLRVWHP